MSGGGGSMGHGRFTVAELGRFLVAPDAGERLSPAGRGAAAEGREHARSGRVAREPADGPPQALVLDLAASTAADVEHWQGVLAKELPLLPCVTIAIEGDPEDPPARKLAGACDVVVPDAVALEPLLSGFAQTPIAALAFVQLLRSAPRHDVYAGLVAESFVYSTLQAGREFGHWLESRRKRARRARPQTEEGPACRLDRDRDRLEIVLARPAKHNAFSRAMRDELAQALQLALADPSIARIVLSGEGGSFCSGGDLDEFGSFPDPAEAHAIRTTRSPALLVSRLAGRIRAEVHGACIGAGVELPAFTDHVVATEDAFFQLPEIGLGLVPGAGGTVSLPRRIGRQRTAWLGLSGARIDARTALEWGLVDEVRLGQHCGPAPTGRRRTNEGERA
ncbi:MAG: enoyl-CoA hydratase/isomerase family protein [Spirochaetaceae bacterium]|nr:enoyl-CoA hydratase/isomerase family protein [Spirochaetaceae bacterium]